MVATGRRKYTRKVQIYVQYALSHYRHTLCTRYVREIFYVINFRPLANVAVSGGSAKWPVIINNGEIKDICEYMLKIYYVYFFYNFVLNLSDHCIYIFFICTDYVGQWPSNQQSCIEYYRRCADLIKTDEYISPTDNGGGGDSGSSEDDTNGDGDGGSGEGGGGDDGGGGGGDDDGDGDGDSQTDDDGLDTKFGELDLRNYVNGIRTHPW